MRNRFLPITFSALILFSLPCNGAIFTRFSDYRMLPELRQNDRPVFDQENQNRVFVTFGGGGSNFHNRVKSICQEAENLAFFTHVTGYTDFDLKEVVDFWTDHGDFIENNPRGYGYWLWKPYVIRSTLRQLNENDLLIYADAGCTVNPKGLSKLQEYVALLESGKYGIIAFQMPYNPEICWTKKVLLECFNLSDEELQEGQFMATAMLIKKNDHSSFLVEEWYRLASRHELINDEITEEEHPLFKENRHDQSIFSLLVKTLGAIKLGDDPEKIWTHESKGEDIPFLATRIR